MIIIMGNRIKTVDATESYKQKYNDDDETLIINKIKGYNIIN